MKIKLLRIAVTIIGIFFLSHNAYSQQERIIFPELSTTVKGAVDQIQKQTRYMISMNNESMNPLRKITLSHNNLTLEEAMKQIIHRTDNTFLIQGRYIVIYPLKKQNVSNKSESPQLTPVPIIAQQGDDVIVPPVDVDSLTRALNARKVDFPAKVPPVPQLNSDAYYMVRDQNGTSTTPHYTNNMPKLALRTNLLYAGATYTPNLGVELALNKKSTLLATGSYNGWAADDNNVKLNHWVASVEYRRWLCEVFNGHFFGLHAFYGYYNVSGKKVPFIFDSNTEDYRYRGSIAGLGVSYGYQFLLGKGWNLELNAGVGAGVANYDKYNCPRCGETLQQNVNKFFVAPTKLGISLIYIIK